MQLCQKRRLYKSAHRGTKEMDIILGNFAKHRLLALNQHTQELYDLLLEEPDPQLFNWIVLKENNFPTQYEELIQEIRSDSINF